MIATIGKNLAAALVKSQAEFPEIAKNAEVEVKKEGKLLYKFKYADLPNIIGAIVPILNANKIFISQSVSTEEGQVSVQTNLIHETGETLGTGNLSMPTPRDPKDLGGHITYMKRYSMVAAFTLAADEDIDAPPTVKHKVSEPKGTGSQPKQSPGGAQGATGGASDKQLATIGKMLGAAGYDKKEDRLDYVNEVLRAEGFDPVKDSKELPSKQASKVIGKLIDDKKLKDAMDKAI
jgi:hypothetical protein